MSKDLLTCCADRGVGGSIRGSVLRHVMRNGSFMVSEIAETTGYSVTTVSKYVAEMLADGLVVEQDRINLHAKGRRAVRYGANPDSYYFIGIDVRIFGLDIALMNFIGEVVRIERLPDFRFENEPRVLEEICDRVRRFIDTTDGVDPAKIVAANMNLTGRVDCVAGTSASVFNFEQMRRKPLAEILSERLGMRVFIENDTKAMIFGEYMSGLNRRYRNLLYVNVDWGLGLGIVVDGRFYHGKDGYSGELGHVYCYDNNILCHCGKKGCIETEVSGRALQRKLLERIAGGDASILSDKVAAGEDITIEDMLAAVNREDPLCIELISRMGSELGRHLAALVNLFNPEAIVLGGGLSQAESYYFHQFVDLAIHQYALKLICQNVPIETAQLGADSGVIGACMIARDRAFGSLNIS